MKKIFKQASLLICSFVMAICAAFAIVNIPTAQAETNSTGLTEKTLTQINPTFAGKTVDGATVDYVEFDGFETATYFLVEFTGKNIPNFAVNAQAAYSTWNSEINSSAYAGNKPGILLLSTCNYNNAYTNEKFLINQGFIYANHGEAALGANLLDDSKNYVLVLGATPDRINSSTAYYNIEYYLFELKADNSLQVVKEYSMYKNAAWGQGGKAIIYPSIGVNTQGVKEEAGTVSQSSITFKYANPARSFERLLENLDGVAYKDDLQAYVNAPADGLKSATLDRIEYAADVVAPATSYIDFDISNFATKDAFFYVDFYGVNAPNFAFNTDGGYQLPFASGTICLANSDHVGSDGLMILSVQDNRYNHGNRADMAESGFGPGLSYLSTNKHYGMIVGVDFDANGDKETIHCYVFVLSTTAELKISYNSWSNNISTPTRNKVSIYGNMANSQYSPASVSFKYAQPANTIGELLTGLDSDYAYKNALLSAMGYKTVTTVDGEGKTVNAEVVSGTSYTLPAYATGVVAYDYEGALYKAGTPLEIAGDITVKQVKLDLALTKGASVRKGVSENGYGGLRFQVTANAATLAAYADKIALDGAILPTDLLGSNEFTLETENAQKKTLANCTTKDGVNTYYITLTNILYSNYNRNFSARAFATVTYADETTAVFATEYDESYARSVYAVAEEALNAGETDNAGVLANYVGYTVNVVKDGDTYALKDTTVTTYEIAENVVTVKNIPANLLSAAVEGKLWIPVTVWEGDTATRKVVQATLDGATATFTLN